MLTVKDKPTIKLTMATLKVLAVFLNLNQGQELTGADVFKRAGLKSGTVYPLLARLSQIGWLKSSFEDIDPNKEGRPPRKMYSLTEKGYREARKLINTEISPNVTDILTAAPI
ncbi:PadR family transcriptional regulator [Thiolapillus sp.]